MSCPNHSLRNDLHKPKAGAQGSNHGGPRSICLTDTEAPSAHSFAGVAGGSSPANPCPSSRATLSCRCVALRLPALDRERRAGLAGTADAAALWHPSHLH